jgi:hypothetical protein
VELEEVHRPRRRPEQRRDRHDQRLPRWRRHVSAGRARTRGA